MPSSNVNLIGVAVILWSGMLIISGSIWVLASQVRKLADLFEDREHNGSSVIRPPTPDRSAAAVSIPRVSRRSTNPPPRRSSRVTTERWVHDGV